MNNDLKQIFIQSIAACMQEDGSLWYKGYSGGNAVACYADQVFGVNAAACYHANNALNEVMGEVLA